MIFTTISNFLIDSIGYFISLSLWSLFLGSLSMLIYYYLSPQKYLIENRLMTTRLNRLIKGNFNKDKLILKLTFKLLKTTMQKFLMSLVPTLIAVLPIFLIWDSLSVDFEKVQLKSSAIVKFVNTNISQPSIDMLPQREYIPYGPIWLRSWVVILMLGITVSSLGLKYILRIE